MLTAEQKDRLAWLNHCLSDADAGRLMSREKLYALDEERDHLRKLATEPGGTMSNQTSGRVTSFKSFEGRTDICAIAVVTGTDSGSGVFNCHVPNVSLNGTPAKTLLEIDAFVTEHRGVRARITNADWSQEGTGFVPCDSIELTAQE